MTACQSTGPYAAEAINCSVKFYTVTVLQTSHIANVGEVIGDKS